MTTPHSRPAAGPRVTANVEAQIRFSYAEAVRKTEAYRFRWSAAVPTEARAAALGRLTRQWQKEADAWKAVLDMIMADRVYDRLETCRFCGHPDHGPDTEEMDTCSQTGCGCRTERTARR
jgi:hypothetical protein